MGRQDADPAGAGDLPADALSPALKELLPRYLPQMVHFVRNRLYHTLQNHESATDLVHSVCGDLLATNLHFKYQGEAQFARWLQVVVLNKVRCRLRQRSAQKRGGGVRVFAVGSGFDGLACGQMSPEEHAALQEDLQKLDQAIAGLPDHYREVLVRSRLLGQSREDVAAAIGRTEASTRCLLSRALVKLAAALDRSS